MLAACPAAARDPISAIDWLDSRDGIAALPLRTAPTIPSVPVAPAVPAEPPVARTIVTPEVTTSPLDAPQTGAVGLLPRSVTGLPATLWQSSIAAALNRRITALDVPVLPAMQSLLYTLLLAEATPPAQDPGGMTFLLARIDTLTTLGAVDPAFALAERAGPETSPALFARWFDLALLTGEEYRACTAMRARPALAPSAAALTYCRAMQGQYDLATLTFGNAAALDLLTPSEESLLRLFLDPDLAEGTPVMPPPARTTPLSFRLAEAIGQALPVAGLPRAYAMADLRGVSGWRAEIEAAERLVQSGALSENRLLGIYTDRRPAASGGIWDRVAAVQALDAAMAAGDPQAVGDTLPAAWDALRAIELEVPFARLWAADLATLPLTGRAAQIGFDMALLSPEYEALATTLADTGPAQGARGQFLVALARGEPDPAVAPDTMGAAIARGFASDADIPASTRLDLAQGKLGEAILSAMSLVARAAEGSTKDITPALAVLRAVGLEDTARRAALQLMLLERRP